MTVSRKWKRPITVDGREYLWWVRDDDDPPFVPSNGKSLRIVDTSGDLALEYYLGQPSDLCHVVVTGRRFRGLPDCGGVHRRFKCPLFATNPAITPADIAAVIRWSEEAGAVPVEVNYLGLPIPTPAPHP
jgi:hypothetical protein